MCRCGHGRSPGVKRISVIHLLLLPSLAALMAWPGASLAQAKGPAHHRRRSPRPRSPARARLRCAGGQGRWPGRGDGAPSRLGRPRARRGAQGGRGRRHGRQAGPRLVGRVHRPHLRAERARRAALAARRRRGRSGRRRRPRCRWYPGRRPRSRWSLRGLRGGRTNHPLWIGVTVRSATPPRSGRSSRPSTERWAFRSRSASASGWSITTRRAGPRRARSWCGSGSARRSRRSQSGSRGPRPSSRWRPGRGGAGRGRTDLALGAEAAAWAMVGPADLGLVLAIDWSGRGTRTASRRPPARSTSSPATCGSRSPCRSPRPARSARAAR